MTYTPTQVKWLKFHYAKWRDTYGWSPRQFAQQTKQPPDALALALGVPVRDFDPPPQIAVPGEPVALPNPETAIITIEGVEVMPREKPPAAAQPKPYRRRSWVLLTPGRHTVDGVEVYVHPAAGPTTATLVEYEVSPDIVHIIDGKNAVVQTVGMFQI